MLIGLNEAFAQQKVLMAFNFFNLETMLGILNAAKAQNKIVIAAFGESYIKHTPLPLAAEMSKTCSCLYDIPFVLHLDHATDVKVIEQAMKLAFTSVMYDGSHLPLDENISNTAMVVRKARAHGVAVEGELGRLNREDGTGQGDNQYTSVAESIEFVQRTGIDTLAIAVGNAHGKYNGIPHINLDRVQDISDATKCPLVLHGCSGIPPDVLRQAFASGVQKINVNTDISMAASAKLLSYSQCEIPRFEVLMNDAKNTVQHIVQEYLQIL